MCVVRQGLEMAEMSSSFQSQNILLSVHPYTGKLNSETPGGAVQKRFYNGETFQDHMT